MVIPYAASFLKLSLPFFQVSFRYAGGYESLS